MLTVKQQKDLETIKYFIPKAWKNVTITDEDVKMFFEYSDQGKNKEKRKDTNLITTEYAGFNALCDGKKWRGIHTHELYEKGILDGSMPYYVILEDMPRSVVDFLKKEMFTGIDSEVIEECYVNYTNI